MYHRGPQNHDHLPARIWRSAVRSPLVPRTDRQRRRYVFETFWLHFRPSRVPAATLRFTHTFGLGGSTLVLLALLAVTGILQLFIYEPTPESAYESIVTLEGEYLFGSLVRGVHYWSANLVVVVALLHLLRVLFTGGFLAGRRFNWLVGVALLTMTLAANFTGYLLPWDQLSYWAVTICTGMLEYVPWAGIWLRDLLRGGPDVGPATLDNFATLHTTAIPVVLLLLLGLHFWRVRKAGGVVPPRPVAGAADGTADRDGGAIDGGARAAVPAAKPEKVLFVPHLLQREVAQALVLLALVLVLAFLRGAPLGELANPGMSPNPAKAPWYFQGFQELQIHLHPVVAIFVVPIFALLMLLLLPYLGHDDREVGIWFRSPRGRRLAVVAAAAALVVTPVLVVLDERWRGPAGWFPQAWPFLGSGLAPLVVGIASLSAVSWWLRRHARATGGETIQTLFVLVLVSFLVLTATSVWFRGAGMALSWPGGG